MGSIVVVAANATMRSQLRNYLTDLGYVTVGIGSLSAAIELAGQGDLSMVVLDGDTAAAASAAGISALHALRVPVIWTRSTPRGIAALFPGEIGETCWCTLDSAVRIAAAGTRSRSGTFAIHEAFQSFDGTTGAPQQDDSR